MNAVGGIVQDALAVFVGAPLVGSSLEKIKEIMVKELKAKCVDGGGDIVDITVEPGESEAAQGTCTIVANNLFTCLLLDGHYVPPVILGDSTEWEVLGVGTYRRENKEFVLIEVGE